MQLGFSCLNMEEEGETRELEKQTCPDKEAGNAKDKT